jgi:hypothetical protein
MKLKIITALALTSALTFVACAVTGDPLDNFVLASPSDLIEGVEYGPDKQATLINIEDILASGGINTETKDIILSKFEGESILAATTRRFLKEGVTEMDFFYISVPTKIDQETGQSGIDWSGFFGSLIAPVGAAFPEFAPLLLPVYWLFRKRSRQHIGEAIKAFLPTNGKMDFGQVLASMDKAAGGGHSSNDPEELKRVADKLNVTNETPATKTSSVK